MADLINVTFHSGKTLIATDDFAEYDKPTKTLSALSMRWHVDNQSSYLQKPVTVKATFQENSSPFINDMKMTHNENNFTRCGFTGS